jgi:hypothetical protein
MSQDSGVLPALRSLVIFTAFASALYLLLVWNPVGSLGDVRNYLEHRVRVPVEWIAVVFPGAWLIQRNDGYTTAAAVFVPISVLILALTKPDYGAEFWRIFREEIYLAPFYAKRGLLVCFLLLSLVAFTRFRWNDRGTLALCLIIGFALTSWEALITPSPPNTFEGGGWFVGWWTEPMHAGWGVISHYIEQYIPPDYRNAARIGVSLYPFLAVFLLLFPSYRKLPKDFIRDYRLEHLGEFPTFLFVGVFLALSGWAFWTATRGPPTGFGTTFLLGILSIPAVLALIALVLSSIVWIPVGLFLLPAWLFWVVSQPLKVAYFLVVKAPFMVLHYLHYLMVPHPAEQVYKNGLAAGMPLPELARDVARTMYIHDLRIYEQLPPAWKLRNQKKRIQEAEKLLHAGRAFMSELEKCVLQDARLRD